MKVKPVVLLAGVLAVASALFACTTQNPNRPTMSFGAPLAQQPANGVVYNYNQQPITLTITNVVRTGSDPVTYSVDVATDSAFANKVFTQGGLPEGSGGTTSVTVTVLAGNATYYWRWTPSVGGIAGAPSATQSFFVKPNIVLNPPVAVSPASGGVATGTRPTFTVNNSTFSGQPGPITYEFQVSTTNSFSTLVTSALVPQQAGATTSWTPNTDIPIAALFWRARARDLTNNVNSDFSSAAAFTIQTFDFTKAIIQDNPPSLGSWAQTSNITLVDFSTGRLIVDFDKRDGPNRWPDSPFGSGTIEYTLGMCLNISNQWYCSAVVQFWYGRDLPSGGDVDNIAGEWFYDSRWGAMQGHQPAPGEIVGIFTAAGNLRDSGTSVSQERTNVQFVSWGTGFSTQALLRSK